MTDATTSTIVSAIEVAREVAKNLVGWHAAELDASMDGDPAVVAMLVHEPDKAGVKLYVQPDGRVEMHGTWPMYESGSRYHPAEYMSITVKGARAPAEIARDVERRLLAKYLPAYLQAVERVRDSDLATRSANECLARLSERVSDIESVYRLRVVSTEAGPRVSFEVSKLDEITATRVLQLLKDAPTNERASATQVAGAGEED